MLTEVSTMKVISITPRGYCKGVVRAISIAKKQAFLQEKVTILGMIVHNQYIVDALEALNIKTIDKKGALRTELLEQVTNGTVIITAHGASDKVIKNAKEKGLTVVDATCPDVIKTHTLIKQYLEKGYHVLYIGKNGHPEAEGAISIDPKNIHLIESKEDIDSLDQNKQYVITNQTTMSLYDVYHICQYAKEILSNVVIEKEICDATNIRQKAIASMDTLVDVVFIVGDIHSNNTKKLAQIAIENGNRDVYMIQSVKDIKLTMLEKKQLAAVSSGASTPTYLTNQVITYLQQFDIDNVDTHATPDIDLSKIL